MVDDVLATVGTIRCISDLLSSAGKETTGYSIVIEIESFKGREKLQSPVISQLLI